MNTAVRDSVLFIGISAIAFPMGFMVGASASPIAGVALPAIFGLVGTAVGLLRPGSISKKELELLVASQEESQLKNYLDSLQKSREQAPVRLGLALTIFGLVYFGGTLVGINARIGKWFTVQPEAAHAFPWVSNTTTKPITIVDALEWIELQKNLMSRGYTPDQISELYQIQVDQWSARTSTTQPEDSSGQPPPKDPPSLSERVPPSPESGIIIYTAPRPEELF